MKIVEPQVYLVAVTEMGLGLAEYLADIGVPEWKSDTYMSTDELVEVAGRLCYRSWDVPDESRPDASNLNIARVRTGNREYLANVLKQGHGSVFEHVNMSVIFRNVSRVFSHELVRHRAGCSYSQESLRFVRPGELGYWPTPALVKLGVAAIESFNAFMEAAEFRWEEFVRMFGPKPDRSFTDKKIFTSMARRLLPMGIATTILMTANVRAWRHILNMRAATGAEEEMRFIMPKLAVLLRDAAPACFQDLEIMNDTGECRFELNKNV